jgi:hypothetical protein
MSGNTPVEYFNNDHVFALSGHSSDDLFSARYSLKSNEFYANATICRRVTSLPTKPFGEFIDINNTQKFRIPKPGDKSYYILDSPSFPFRTTLSKDKNKQNGAYTFEQDAFKIYVPFSEAENTRTIPNSSFSICDDLYKDDRTLLETDKRKIIYNGKEYIFPPGKYTIRYIRYCGVLSASSGKGSLILNNNYRKFEDNDKAMNVAAAKLDIDRIFRLDTTRMGTPLVFPENQEFDVLFNKPGVFNDYLRNAFDIAFSASVLHYSELVNMAYYTSFGEILFASLHVDELFEKIRRKLNDNKPIFIINPLCRAVTTVSNVDKKIVKLKRQNSITGTNLLSLGSKNTARYKKKKKYLRSKVLSRILNTTRKNLQKQNKQSIHNNILNAARTTAQYYNKSINKPNTLAEFTGIIPQEWESFLKAH